MSVDSLLREWQELSGPVRLFAAGGGSWIIFFLVSVSVDKLYRCPVKGKDWIWKNRCMSWLHAAVASILTLKCMYDGSAEYWHDNAKILAYHSYLMQFTLSVSVGYFLHDLADNMVHTFNFGLESIAVVGHHLVAIVMFGLFTCMDRFCAFVMLALATEINSVFLHNRKLLQLAGYEITDFVYVANNVANVLTFFVFRVGGQLYMKYRIVLVVGMAPSSLWVCGLLAMTSLQMVNVALANSLFASDMKRWRQLQKVRRSTPSGTRVSDLPGQKSSENGVHSPPSHGAPLSDKKVA